MGYLYHSTKLEFCHGGDTVTEGFNEEERHKDFCFKQITWMACWHDKKCIVFILHICMSIFCVYAFSCGLFICTGYTDTSNIIQLNCMIVPFLYKRSKVVKYHNFK